MPCDAAPREGERVVAMLRASSSESGDEDCACASDIAASDQRAALAMLHTAFEKYEDMTAPETRGDIRQTTRD